MTVADFKAWLRSPTVASLSPPPTAVTSAFELALDGPMAAAGRRGKKLKVSEAKVSH